MYIVQCFAILIRPDLRVLRASLQNQPSTSQRMQPALESRPRLPSVFFVIHSSGISQPSWIGKTGVRIEAPSSVDSCSIKFRQVVIGQLDPHIEKKTHESGFGKAMYDESQNADRRSITLRAWGRDKLSSLWSTGPF